MQRDAKKENFKLHLKYFYKFENYIDFKYLFIFFHCFLNQLKYDMICWIILEIFVVVFIVYTLTYIVIIYIYLFKI